jgi:large subunit ribosomal protein L18
MVVNQRKLIQARRQRRQLHVRKRLFGKLERPRLAVFRSSKHIYAQVVNDLVGKTLAAAGTLDKDLRASLKSGGNKAAAEAVGKALAERAKAAGVTQVSFDRRGYKFHGRVKALADAARAGGLQF